MSELIVSCPECRHTVTTFVEACASDFYQWRKCTECGHVFVAQVRDEVAELKAEIERLRKALDDAGDAIAKVVACCTYGSEEQAKVGAYGISHEAFTLIDTFIRKHGDLLNTLKGGE